ncbi:MAG: uracil-DNA glycosylase family protein [Candidatus Limnocylindrus sp.]
MKSVNPELKQLYDQMRDCRACKLSECRQRVVFGSGNPRAKVLIVVDTPSEAEDRVGHYNTADIRWLVHLFSQALNLKMPIAAAAEKFFAEAFITPAVMCRPIIMVGDAAGTSRDPKWSDVKACRDRLTRMIYQIDPHIIVGCGKYALMGLCGTSSPPAAKTGRLDEMLTITVQGELGDVHYSVIPAPDPQVAKRRGDYDDPNGVVRALGSALSAAWAVRDTLESEDH